MSYERAQAQYDAQTPPEPLEFKTTVEIEVTEAQKDFFRGFMVGAYPELWDELNIKQYKFAKGYCISFTMNDVVAWNELDANDEVEKRFSRIFDESDCFEEFTISSSLMKRS